MISAEGIVWNGLDRRIAQTAEAIGLKGKPEYYENFCEMLYQGILLEAFFDIGTEKIPFEVSNVLDEITLLGVSEVFILYGEEEYTLEDAEYLAFRRKAERAKASHVAYHLERLCDGETLPQPIAESLFSTVEELEAAFEVAGSIEQMLKLKPEHLPKIPAEKLYVFIRNNLQFVT